MNDTKKLKVTYAPGCFDDFEGTQEELDELLQEINRLVESGELFEKSTVLTDEMIDDLSDEELEKIYNSVFEVESTTNKTLH